MKRLLLVTAVVIMSCAAACGGSSNPTTPSTTAPSTAMPGTPVAVEGGGTYWSVTPAQLASIKVKDFILVDTDTTYIGEIGGTDLFLNSDTISQNLDKFPSDKATKIVIYCASGMKSQTVAATLVQAGYMRVMQLVGGIIAWQQQGYPTIFKTRTMT
jgi:rhodanese-related sulfurtransferase